MERGFFLFDKTSYTWRDIKNIHSIEISDSFINCADLQLKNDFEKKTGIKAKAGKICITIFTVNEFNYLKSDISQLDICVAITHHGNMAKVCWRSKSGKIYELSDEEIDCTDIEFWFEDLNPVLYHQQLYPNEPLPFKLSKTNFELIINRLTIDLIIGIFFENSTMEERFRSLRVSRELSPKPSKGTLRARVLENQINNSKR